MHKFNFTFLRFVRYEFLLAQLPISVHVQQFELIRGHSAFGIVQNAGDHFLLSPFDFRQNHRVILVCVYRLEGGKYLGNC
jgi:hypothetical protein